MTYLLLFYEFFKTGLFAVGGGMATLPFLYDMSARHPDWFSASQIADMVAVAESTPDPHRGGGAGWAWWWRRGAAWRGWPCSIAA